MKIIFGILAIVVIVLLYNYLMSPKWSLFVYPNGNVSEDAIKNIDTYKSLEECRDGYNFNLRTFPNATYECGYKCKIQDKSLGLYMCEETVE